MTFAAQVEIRGASVEFIDRRLETPLVLSSGTIDSITEARATVTVKAGGVEASGRGAVYLSHRWAWPGANRGAADCDAAMCDACRAVANHLVGGYVGHQDHPWEIGLQWHAATVDDWPGADKSIDDRSAKARPARAAFRSAIDQQLPALARMVCLSPFDAALHDAAGLALGRSSFHLFDPPLAIPSADMWFSEGGACRAVTRVVRPSPRRVFPATLVVGPNDRLDEHLDRWIRGRRYGRVKLKLLGTAKSDAQRVADVVRGLSMYGVADPWLILDANEAYRDVSHVDELLDAIGEGTAAWRALRYLEQPTSRDLQRDVGDWRRVTRRKPVLVDEGLTSLTSLARAVEQGWSGAAIKTCKGHSFCLLAVAWLLSNGHMVTLQDLTNPGFAAIHAALFAAFFPTDNGVELNSPQFTPQANADGPWLPRLSALFEPYDGVHRLPAQLPPGLGSTI